MATSFWVIIGMIAVTAIISRSIVSIIKVSKSGGGKGESQKLDDLESDLATLEQDLEDARSRIEVLEKIVTDDKYNLGKQIDDLAN